MVADLDVHRDAFGITDQATIAKAGYPECVAMIVQIGDHLSKQYDVKG